MLPTVCVNMILINMMMAIINMAFEDIKSQASAYESKFDIIAYIKKSSKELSGLRYVRNKTLNVNVWFQASDEGLTKV